MKKSLMIMKHVLLSWKPETSKLILYLSYLIAITLTVITVIGTFSGVDMSNVVQITLASYGEVAVCNAFYLKKAARENIFKNLPEKYLEDVDINNLV